MPLVIKSYVLSVMKQVR